VQAHESRDCGAACLATIALHYGARLDVGKVAILAETTMQGARLDKLRDAAHRLGFAASCGKVREGQIESIPLPAVLHLLKPEGEHYVVLLKRDRGIMRIADPSIGIRNWPAEDILKEFSGFVLLLKPDADFKAATSVCKGKSPLRITLDTVAHSGASFSVTSLMALLALCTSLAVPFFISRMIDRTYTDRGRYPGAAEFTLILFLAIAFARAAFTMAKQACLAGLAVQTEKRHLSRFVNRVLSLPLDFFDRCHPGDLIARVNDASLIRSAVAGPILTLVLDSAYLAVASLLLLRSNPILLAVAVLSVAAAFAVHSWVRPSQVMQTRILRARMTELMNSMLEAITNIRLLKTFGQESNRSEGLLHKHSQSLAALREMTTLAGWSTTAGLLINGAGLAGIIVAAQKLIAAHQFTPGNLTYVVAVSSVMMASTETLASSMNSMEEVALSAERLAHTERAAPEPVLPESPATFTRDTPCIRFSSVTFAYGAGDPVLRDITFSLLPGEVLGIKGESGSGKSTLAVLCNGLYQPQAGEVLAWNRPLREWNLDALRERIRIVFSDSNLISGTIRDNLTFGSSREVAEDELLQATKLAFAHDFIEALPNGYSYRVGHMGFGLSSGQRQRIALARMLLVKPEILILDEATSNLDIPTEREILHNLLAERKGYATIIISHRPETLLNADRVMEISRGRITTNQDTAGMAYAAT
jgi:ATP-binding cassette, subfamily C, bacteriocin exporter